MTDKALLVKFLEKICVIMKSMTTLSKIDFKKLDKKYYYPKDIEIIDVPRTSFITISGAGAPADVKFQEAIQKLYPVAYAISMSYKRQDVEITGFQPFVVPPLEGLWTSKEAPENGVLDKSSFIWKIMLRMPDFVTRDTVEWAKTVSADKKKMDFSEVIFEEITDGKCVQAIHTGSFDTETETFEKMINFAAHAGYRPIHKNFHHREIYLGNFRKTVAEKLKTVLRLYLEKID